jgi:hypothetical protein
VADAHSRHPCFAVHGKHCLRECTCGAADVRVVFADIRTILGHVGANLGNITRHGPWHISDKRIQEVFACYSSFHTRCAYSSAKGFSHAVEQAFRQ